MIKFNISIYCQNCPDFEPQVTQRPEQIKSNYGGSYFYGDTLVECKYRNRCETIYNYLKKEKNNGFEDSKREQRKRDS